MAAPMQSDEYAAHHDPEGLHQRRASKRKSSLEHGANPVADELLEAMGYKSELVRSRSTAQVAFMSFVLASIPYGLSTTFFYPLVNGGPANIIWGWVMVSIIILCVAISLGEITSVYPTAGGVYYQTFMLAPPSYRLIASWICGWAFVVGNITITLAVNFGTAQFYIACINVFESSSGVGIFPGEPYQVFLLFVAVTVVCNLVCTFGNRWLPWLDTFAIYWTMAGLVCIIICVLVIAKNGRHDASYVFGELDTSNSGWPTGWSFCVGLLQAAYATSSTGMIISMCEEVQEPATQVPKAMTATIVINFFAGFAFLVPLVFVLPNQADLVAIASGQPVPTIIKSAVGSSGGAIGLLLPLMVLGLICGIGCTTAASRSVWAFSRDGAIPGFKWWKVVNERLDVPVNAMMLSAAVQIVLGVIYFGSSAAYNAFSGVGVVCLTLSYAVPIAVSLFGGRKQIAAGSFNLGIVGAVCNWIAVGWSLLAIPLFCMPSYLPVEATTMNYASVVFFAFFVIASAWYFIWGKKNYRGPPTNEDTVLAARKTSVVSVQNK